MLLDEYITYIDAVEWVIFAENGTLHPEKTTDEMIINARKEVKNAVLKNYLILEKERLLSRKQNSAELIYFTNKINSFFQRIFNKKTRLHIDLQNNKILANDFYNGFKNNFFFKASILLILTSPICIFASLHNKPFLSDEYNSILNVTGVFLILVLVISYLFSTYEVLINSNSLLKNFPPKNHTNTINTCENTKHLENITNRILNLTEGISNSVEIQKTNIYSTIPVFDKQPELMKIVIMAQSKIGDDKSKLKNKESLVSQLKEIAIELGYKVEEKKKKNQKYNIDNEVVTNDDLGKIATILRPLSSKRGRNKNTK